MKKIIIAAFILAATSAAAQARECLPGMDPAKDNCQVTEEQEPAPQPELQDVDQVYYCLELQKIAVKIAELRDKGAGEQGVVTLLANNNQNRIIWVARQVFWPQSASLRPEQVGLRVWMRCNSGEYPGGCQMKLFLRGVLAMLNDELFWLLVVLAACAVLVGVIYG